MRILRSFDYDHCTIEQVSYKGDLYMPPHVDDESKIGDKTKSCFINLWDCDLLRNTPW